MNRNIPRFGLSWAAALLAAALPLAAQITITGVADRATYTDTASFLIVTQAGYALSAQLNGQAVPVGSTVTVTRMDYYDLWAWRTNLAAPFDVTSRLVRFIVLASDRGSPEKGLPKWTPYPSIPSTTAELAGARLTVTTPAEYPAGLPIPVVAWVDDVQSREIRVNGAVTAPGFAGREIAVLRGAGSGFLPAATNAGALVYDARLGPLVAPKQILIDSNTAWTTVSGTLSGTNVWPTNARIRVTGGLTIPADSLLTVEAGAVVTISPLVNITNSGRMVIAGTPERPVVLTATNVVWPENNAGAWGGFVARGSNATLEATNAIFAGGGGGLAWNFGPGSSHKSQQPLLFFQSNAVVRLAYVHILNTAGQVGNGYNSDLTLDHCLWQRAITCGEYVGGAIVIRHSALIEFPVDDGVVNATIVDSDYDGIYFTLGTHILEDSLIGFAKDDAIDSGTGGAGTMWVTNCWIESALHEAHAWSGQGRVAQSFDTVLLNSGQGLEAGFTTGAGGSQLNPTSPAVYAERVLSLANGVGVRFGDNYDWSYQGFLRVTNCVVLHNLRDVFAKTWNTGGTGWDTNRWVDRLAQMDLRQNRFTAANGNFPDNAVWDPVADAGRLARWMTTPTNAPVGIGLALRTNRADQAALAEGVPVRLSSFTTHPVSVDYAVLGGAGPLAAGTLTFLPGETVKFLPPLTPGGGEPVVEVRLKNPAGGEVTGLGTAWYTAGSSTNTGQYPLVLQGSWWSYRDTASDPGGAWRSNDYVEAGWKTGRAQLGFGDGDETTVVATNGQTTTYFRQFFVVDNPALFTNLALWLLRDDGGVVHLNGGEVYRSPTLPQPPTNITYATWTVGSAPPDNTVDQASVSPGALQAGTNLVAVEIHQVNVTSSDLSFDFKLTGQAPVPFGPPGIVAGPTNLAVAEGGAAAFTVTATGAAPLACQWWFGPTQRLEQTLGPALTLTGVTVAATGDYFVVVVNARGAATSSVASLSLIPADGDGDGMPDAWEQAHGLNPGANDAGLDPDGDGMTNLEEWLAGTDPQDSRSRLAFAAAGPAAGELILYFPAMSNRAYRVETAGGFDPPGWEAVTNIPAAPANRVVDVRTAPPAEPAVRAYRVRTP